jgi:hypothetical protein
VEQDVDAYAGPEPAGEPLPAHALDDLGHLEVPAAGMLPVQERGGEPDLLGDPHLGSD